MKRSRREFLAAGIAAGTAIQGSLARGADEKRITKADLDKVLDQPVLNTALVKGSVVVESVELLKSGRNFLLRTRSVDGAEAITVPNPERMNQTWPIFLKDVVPVFIKRDARE